MISHYIGILNINYCICGIVTVCREWLVHEDGALAYRLQDEESMKKIMHICYISYAYAEHVRIAQGRLKIFGRS